MIKRNLKGKWFFLMVAAIVVLPVLGFGQQQERLIDKESWRNEPIKILNLKTKDKSIELGTKFSEDDDWLYGLTVTVQNTSDKAIAQIDFRLIFPRPGGGSTPETANYAAHLIYGKDPADVSPQEVLKLVSPGEKVDVKLLEVNVPFIKEDLEKLGYEQPVKHARIVLRAVTFVDDSEWAGDDDLLYPDPNNPKRKLNPKFPLELWPKESKPPPHQSRLHLQTCGSSFLNADVRRAHAPQDLKSRQIFMGKF